MPNRRQCHWNSRQGHRCTFALRGKVSETLPMPQTENATRLFLIVSECHRRSASPPPPQCQIVPPPTCTPARPPPPPSRPPRRITIAHQQECQHISYIVYNGNATHTHKHTLYPLPHRTHNTPPSPPPHTHARTHARSQRSAPSGGAAYPARRPSPTEKGQLAGGGSAAAAPSAQAEGQVACVGRGRA